MGSGDDGVKISQEELAATLITRTQDSLRAEHSSDFSDHTLNRTRRD